MSTVLNGLATLTTGRADLAALAHVITMAGWETGNVWLVDDATGESFSVGPESFSVSGDGLVRDLSASKWSRASRSLNRHWSPTKPTASGWVHPASGAPTCLAKVE